MAFLLALTGLQAVFEVSGSGCMFLLGVVNAVFGVDVVVAVLVPWLVVV
jgi:hypothetical protein